MIYKKYMKLFEHVMGFIVISLGIIFVINAQLGAGAMDAFNYYLAALLSKYSNFVTLGRIAIVNGTVVMFFTYFLSRDKKVFISFIYLFIVGNFIDMWQWVFNFVPGSIYDSLLERVILASIGVLVVSFGVSMTLLSGHQPSPFESLLVVLDKKINNISITKTLIDGTYLIASFVLGYFYGDIFEQIGLFTIVLTFLTGFFVKHFSNHISRFKSRKEAIENVT